MSSFRDPSLAIPVFPPGPTEPLPLHMAPLRRVVDADGVQWVHGIHADAAVTGSHTQAIRLGDGSLRHYLHVVRTKPVARDVTSIGVDSLHDIDGSQCLERFVLSTDVAAIITEWIAPHPVEAVLTWSTHANDEDLRWNADGPTLVIAGAAEFVCVTVTPAESLGDGEWTVRDVSVEGNARIVARIDVRITTTPTKLYATSAGSPDDFVADFDRIADAPAHMLAQVATQRRRASQEISLTSPEESFDNALAWGKQLIAQRIMLKDDDRFVHALAALACGDDQGARDAIDTYQQDDASFLMMLARYHAFTGDSASVMRSWTRAESAAAQAATRIDSTLDDATAALDIEALSDIAATAGDIGQARFSADLQTLVKRARTQRAVTQQHMHWLDAIDHPAARTWHLFETGASTAGVDALRMIAAHAHDEPAAFIVPLLYGLFGIQPEAARNRLRLRPQLPLEWESATIERVRMGDAVVSLEYQRETKADATVHRFTAEQTMGGVPVRLILEPVVAASILQSATVDNTPASLDALPFGDRMMVPVQLMLDDIRVVEITTHAASGQ